MVGHLAWHPGCRSGVREAAVLPLLRASVRVWAAVVTNPIRMSLLTGGDDPDYAIPLATALAEQSVIVDFVGNDGMASAPSLKHANIRYLNLRGSQDRHASTL